MTNEKSPEQMAEEWWVNYPGDNLINPGVNEVYGAWRRSHQIAFLAGFQKCESQHSDYANKTVREVAALTARVSSLTAALEKIAMCGHKYEILGQTVNPKYGLIHAPEIARKALAQKEKAE